MKKLTKAMLATLAILLMASVCWGKEPPPPVNQSLGIPDSVFDRLVEADCRGCHNQTPPISAVNPTYLPDRHHLLVGKPVPTGTAAPNPTVGKGTYECLTCHTQVWDPATFSFVFTNFNDCMLCHSQNLGGGTVHHMTAKAQGGDCVVCHGGFVQNMNDGHYIPTYKPSLVTPWPSKKPNADNKPGLVGAGNCNFCHNTATGSPTPTLDLASGVWVYRNAETHHSTGFVLDGGKCSWCHYQGTSVPQALSIRTCQGCHGVKSLHNIQLGLGATTQPGNEPPYLGHIGNQWDCWGCHGNNGQIMSAAPYSGPVIPAIDSLSASTFVEGTNTTITVAGKSFINSIKNPMTGSYDIVVNSAVKLVDGLGNVTTLQPVSVTNTAIEVVIPSYLAVGSYTLAAVKGPSDSNPKVITVKPAVAISSAACDNGTVTIRGNGFGAYADAANSGTSVTMLNGTAAAKCQVSAWTDNQITAQCGAGDTIQVASVFGKASSSVAGCEPQPVILPAITKLSTTAARVGSKVTISGNNFGATQGASFVEFGTVKAPISSWKTTTISVSVPKVSKGSYPVTVTVAGKKSNAVNFTVR
jgi:hypothetical protein